MTPPPLIAIVEDEEHLAQGLIFNLEAEGFRTRHDADGDAALAWLLDATAPSSPTAPAAILLDVMLPGRDGFSILRALREAGRYTPVLLLTARSRNEDILEGFAAGADDYLPKPFDLNILLARLSSLLRRMHWQTTPTPPGGPFTAGPGVPGGRSLPAEVVEPVSGEPQPSEQRHTPSTLSPASPLPTSEEPPSPAHPYTLANRLIDFDTLEIHIPATTDIPGRTIHLTLMEADLLRYLLDHPNKIVSRKELLENVWRVHEDTDTRAIDNFIVRLRRYLEPDPTHPIHLLTVRGIGYRFAPTP